MFASCYLRRGVPDRLATTTTCKNVLRATSRSEQVIGSAELWHHHQHVWHGSHNNQRRQCYHTHFKFPMAQRNLWDTFTSTFHGLVAVATSEENLKDFKRGLSDNVIPDSILSFAIYHDLYLNPLWSKADFKPTDFLQGVAPALEQFHHTEGLLLNEFPPEDGTEKCAELLFKNISQLEPIACVKYGPRIKNNEGNDDDDEGIKLSDPDSLARQLAGMVAPSIMDDYFFNETAATFQSRYSFNENAATYQPGTTSVENVRLLNVRAMEVEEERQHGEGERHKKEQVTGTDDNALKIKDRADTEICKAGKNTNNSENTGEESSDAPLAVVAEIEVLYNLKQIFLPKENKLKDEEEAENVEEKLKSETEEMQKPREQTRFLLGTFQGWLKGGPDGTLQWRISYLQESIY